MSADRVLRIGTRGSALARWQTDHVAALLRTAVPNLDIEIIVITTRGDHITDVPLPEIGGKGIFTAELEAALYTGEIDLAVHSLKDLPTETPAGLVLGAIIERADPADALVSRERQPLAALPAGAVVGTSSRRRAAQVLHARPDVQIKSLRGNVDTRIRKALDGDYDAIVLACAGLERLDRLNVIAERLAFDVMLPAPGQGALAVQCRDQSAARERLALINHAPTATAVAAERAFLAALGGGCALPIAAYAEVDAGSVLLRGRVSAPDGSRQIDVSGVGSLTNAEQIGTALARQALDQGAAGLLESPP